MIGASALRLLLLCVAGSPGPPPVRLSWQGNQLPPFPQALAQGAAVELDAEIDQPKAALAVLAPAAQIGQAPPAPVVVAAATQNNEPPPMLPAIAPAAVLEDPPELLGDIARMGFATKLDIDNISEILLLLRTLESMRAAGATSLALARAYALMSGIRGMRGVKWMAQHLVSFDTILNALIAAYDEFGLFLLALADAHDSYAREQLLL